MPKFIVLPYDRYVAMNKCITNETSMVKNVKQVGDSFVKGKTSDKTQLVHQIGLGEPPPPAPPPKIFTDKYKKKNNFEIKNKTFREWTTF
jgi:hypothetical protein